MRYYFNRSFLTLTIGASLLVSSCVSLADMSNAMNSDQRDALECKAALETFASAHGHETITQALVDNPPKCTVTKEPSCKESLRNNLGKTLMDVELPCEGEHHKKAGYERNYPRIVPGGRVVDNVKGSSVPPSFLLPLPDDADIVHTGYYHSHGILRFTTGQSMQTFGAKYHQLLGLGEATGRVALENGLSGKFAGVDYSLMYRQDLAVYEIGWVPPVVPAPKDD